MPRARFVLLCSAVFGLVSPLLAYEITLNPNVRHQTMEGWGTSGVSSNTNWRTAYRDLGLNIIRMPMTKNVLVTSATDFATPVVLSDNLQTAIGQFNFNESSIAAYGSFAQWLKSNALPGEANKIKLNGDVWSPPHWMKGPTGESTYWVGNVNNSLGTTAYPTPWLSNQHNGWSPGTSTNSGDSIGGRLKTEDPNTMTQYGRYMAAYVKGFEQKYGVPVYSLSLQNESTFENPFDSAVVHINQAGQTDFNQYAMGLKAVKDAWGQYGITTKVMGPHVANLNQSQSNPYALWWQMSLIEGVKNHSDPELKNFLSFYNSNYYVNSADDAAKMTAAYWGGTASVPGTWANWFNNSPGVHADGKPVWMSETGDPGTTWADQIKLAVKMHNALTHGHASSYIYWQLTDGSGSPTEHALLGSSQTGNPTASKKYSAFKQFSRYIRPGAQRIDAVFENGTFAIGGIDKYDSDGSVDVSAFIDDENHTLTLVLINMLSTQQSIKLNTPSGLDISSFDVYRTSSTENFATLADLIVTNDQVTFNIPARSIMTLNTLIPEPMTLGLLSLATVTLIRKRAGAPSHPGPRRLKRHRVVRTRA